MSNQSEATEGPTARATIREVAALAGVGIKTVSRVINDEPNVSAATIAKVREAAERLDYHPDLNAGNLRRTGRKTRTSASSSAASPTRSRAPCTAASKTRPCSVASPSSRRASTTTPLAKSASSARCSVAGSTRSSSPPCARTRANSCRAGTRHRAGVRRPRARRHRRGCRGHQQRRGLRRGDRAPHRRRPPAARLPRRPTRAVDRAGAAARVSRTAGRRGHPDVGRPRDRRSAHRRRGLRSDARTARRSDAADRPVHQPEPRDHRRAACAARARAAATRRPRRIRRRAAGRHARARASRSSRRIRTRWDGWPPSARSRGWMATPARPGRFVVPSVLIPRGSGEIPPE